jgi:hypothetical protein
MVARFHPSDTPAFPILSRQAPLSAGLGAECPKRHWAFTSRLLNRHVARDLEIMGGSVRHIL